MLYNLSDLVQTTRLLPIRVQLTGLCVSEWASVEVGDASDRKNYPDVANGID